MIAIQDKKLFKDIVKEYIDQAKWMKINQDELLEALDEWRCKAKLLDSDTGDMMHDVLHDEIKALCEEYKVCYKCLNPLQVKAAREYHTELEDGSYETFYSTYCEFCD